MGTFILLFILFGSFILIYIGTYRWQQLLERYPTQDCIRVDKKYEGRLKDFHKDSFDEYVYNQMRAEIGKARFFSGPI